MVVPSHSPIHSPASPAAKLATSVPLGFSQTAICEIRQPGRDVGDRIERSNCIEGGGFKLHIAHIRFDERCCRDVTSSSYNLLHRSIYPDDGMPQGSKIARNWDAGAAAKIEDSAAFRA
jgi:hypothetical protein